MEGRLGFLIPVLFIFIYLIESRLYLLSNFLYPERYAEQEKKIITGWDTSLKKKITQITQKKKEIQKKSAKSRDKWVAAHPPKAFLIIPKIKSPPIIDGRLDERLWRDVPNTTPFTHFKYHTFSEVTTYTRICYDRHNLYVGFHCSEPEMHRIKAKITTHDGKVWTDDSVEIFISPSEKKRDEYYHFILNTIGTKYEAYKLDSSWDGNWKARVSSMEDYWEAEVSIPFRTLGIKMAKLGMVFLANFNRSRYVGDREYSNWSYTGGSFHKPDRFGRIKFGWEVPFIQKITWDSPFGDMSVSVAVKNLSESEKNLELRLSAEKIKLPLKEEGLLKGKGEKIFRFHFKQSDPISATLQLSLYEKGRNFLFYSTPYLPLEPERAFIRSWLICGPFPNPGGRKYGEVVEDLHKVGCRGFNEDFLTSQGGEVNVEPRKGMWQVYRHGIGGKVYRHRWKVKNSTSAKIDFYKVLNPYEYIVVYGATYIISDRSRDAQVRLGSDDGYKLWVNHELIAQDHIHRGSSPDQDIHRIRLRKGKNIILLKIDQDFGGVNFYLRLTDLDGKPLSGVRSVLAP